MWLRLPLRSLLRNPRRTALTLAIIALGTAVSFVVIGFVASSVAIIQKNTVDQFGNLEIASPSLFDRTATGYDYLIPADRLARVTVLLRADPRVTGFSPQLSFSGLAVVGTTTRVVRATGLVPGNAALDYNAFVVEGKGLEPTDTDRVLVGRTLATRLGLRPGDYLSLTVTTVDGAYNVSPLKVAGIFRFSVSEVESQQIYLPLGFAQTLLATDSVDTVVVDLRAVNETNAVAASLGQAVASAGLPLSARTYEVLSPFYRDLLAYFNVLFGFLLLAVGVLVFFIVLQVTTMSFLERTREVGTVRALGTTQGGVFRLFLSESALLGLFGGLLGLVFGALLGSGFNAARIAWQPPGTVVPVFLTVTLSFGGAWPSFAVSWMATVLSALYPALHASRLRVVDALRST